MRSAECLYDATLNFLNHPHNRHAGSKSSRNMQNFIDFQHRTGSLSTQMILIHFLYFVSFSLKHKMVM